MVKYTIEEVRATMQLPAQVRNMSVIAHVDHGKTTLTDSLLAAAGVIALANAGDDCGMSLRPDEIERGITIKSSSISMYFRVNEEILPEEISNRDFLVNLIDSPGHVDFSSEVTAALRVTDGALVVVDCVEGVCVQTETVLRQALSERIKPVLMVNKADRAIIELKLDSEEAYQTFSRTIGSVNVVVATYNDEALGDVQCFPEKGSVCFGSGKQSWAFSLSKFAKMYATKYGVAEEKMMSRLWGDNFFDAKAKKWLKTDTSESGQRLKRAFCQFVWEPILEVFDAVLAKKMEKLEAILVSLGVKLSAEEKELTESKLLKAVMQKWLPASDALLSMIVTQLPSPLKAQSYRAETLYTGPKDDKYYEAIRKCDGEGPLVVYISKMIPTLREKGRFFAFGRVFSGTCKMGQRVRIMGPNYEVGTKTDLHCKAIQRTVVMMGRSQDAVEDVPAGNLIGLVGVDDCIIKTATITGENEKDCFPVKDMKYSVSPVVRIAVEPKHAADLPKLIEGLKRLAKSDPLVQCTIEETGEHIIAGAGELHLEICLNDLRDFTGCELKASQPIVSFRETITSESDRMCLSKSPNGHNRIFAKAQPLNDGLCTDIESLKVSSRDDPKTRTRYLVDTYQWETTEARKLWCFGPDNKGANVVVDMTKAVAYVDEVKDSFVAAWQWATKEGPLCEENMRGIRYDIHDMKLHADAVHRGGGQMIPSARRNVYGCELTAKPRLQEPVFMVDIQTVQQALGGVYSVLNKRRGIILGEENRQGTPVYNVKAYLPVQESFGFIGELRGETHGQAYPQCVFDHWQVFPGDPLDPKSTPGQLVAAIRKRKGLKEEIPALENYLDKL